MERSNTGRGCTNGAFGNKSNLTWMADGPPRSADLTVHASKKGTRELALPLSV